MERIKVLHLITHFGYGGALDNTLLTVQRLSRDRYEVHLAAGKLASDNGYTNWEGRARECSDALFVFPNLLRPIHLSSDLQALQQITDFIREQNYQIVHTHCAKAGVLGRLAARRARVPVIIHTYHSFGWQVAHAFHSSIRKNCLSSAKKWLYVLMERYGASLSDALIAVAELSKREALGYKLAPPEKFATIYSGIDLDRFNTGSASRNKLCRSFGLDPNRPIIGTVGRLSIQKAPLDFVSAAKIILQNKPEVQFIMVGDGPLAPEVKKAIGAEQRIKMLGFQDNVPEILGMLDIFVLSSLWEGLGRALTEAMAMSLPVAATNVNGVPELVAHGKTGMLSPPREPAQLVENIIWLLDHPSEAREMGERARERVVSAFGIEMMVEQIEELYERLLVEKSVHPVWRADYYAVGSKKSFVH
jgi:glycosyltransferase involved in cell wall biosynthesis